MAKKPASKEDKAHMDAVASLGCIICRNELGVFSAAEIHHTRVEVGMGQRSHHTRVLPLCMRHHRMHGYGVSFHDGPGEFQRNFGTELKLLAQVGYLLLGKD